VHSVFALHCCLYVEIGLSHFIPVIGVSLSTLSFQGCSQFIQDVHIDPELEMERTWERRMHSNDQKEMRVEKKLIVTYIDPIT